MLISPRLPSPQPEGTPSGGGKPRPKSPCKRCGALMYDDVEICRECGKWRHGVGLIVAGLVAVVVAMLAAWFVFTNTF